MTTARLLTLLQACPRKLILERAGKHAPVAIRSLLNSQLHTMITGFHGRRVRPLHLATSAQAEILETASSPGLQTAAPYSVAQDLCALQETLAAALERRAWEGLEPLPAPQTTPWTPSVLGVLHGALQRWVTVEHFTKDTLTRELHSWSVLGECAVYNLPMELFIIEMGRVRGEHLHSPWTRIMRHPAIQGRYAFQQHDGTKLEGGWTPFWRASNSHLISASDWVDLMARDKVSLIHRILVQAPTPAQQSQILQDISTELKRADGLPDLSALPIQRPQCDLPLCSWQNECYS